jgi:hypothetical protein
MSSSLENLNPKELSEEAIAKAMRDVNHSLRPLFKEMDHENTLVPETPDDHLQRVLTIYDGIKPLLALLSSFRILPSKWRMAIAMFVQALDALAGTVPEVIGDFKAGKDL